MADMSRLGNEALHLMEQIEQAHPNGEIGEVSVVAEIKYEDQTVIEARNSSGRAWMGIGLLTAAIDSIRARRTPPE